MQAETEIRIKTRGLLFDMDGVLVSSIGSVNRCWRRWAALYDVPGAESYEVPHGRRAIDIVRMLRPDIDAEEGLRVIEDMEMEDNADLTVLPGVAALLRALPLEQWAVVTSCTLRLAESRLQKAGLPLPLKFITAESVVKGKPDPEPYCMGAELLGVAAADCVVVEDAPSGVGAGKAAGMRVLGLLTSHAAEELTDADWLVGSLADVLYERDGGEDLVLRFAPARFCPSQIRESRLSGL